MGPDQLVFFWLILSSLALCALLFGIRYFNNRENMAMIEKGLDPKLKPERRPAPFRNLKWGLLLVGSGIGLFLAYLLDNTLLYNVRLRRQRTHLFCPDSYRRGYRSDYVLQD
jgi:hypothetical protein